MNDTTVEKLGELLNQNPNGLLLFRDELSGFLHTMDRPGHENDRAFYCEACDTSTPAGKALFQMLGVFAEFERAIIVERVHAGSCLGGPKVQLMSLVQLRDGPHPREPGQFPITLIHENH